MKKFILDISIISILVFLSVMGLYRLGTPALVSKSHVMENKLEIINLGTSHGDNFDYSYTDLKGLAFNKPANTLYYDLQHYRYLKEHLAGGAIILLPISYYSFGLDENRTDMDNNGAFVNDFYEYLPEKFIYDYSEEKAMNLKVHRIQQNVRNFFIKESDQSQEQDTSSLNYHASHRVVHHKEIGEYSSVDKNIAYLDALIIDAITSGYKPVLITTPYYKKYNQGFEADWLEKNYYSYISSLIEKHGIVYLNYASHPEISSNPELFFNSDHLNEKGKAIFNKILFSDLQKRGLIKANDTISGSSQQRPQ